MNKVNKSHAELQAEVKKQMKIIFPSAIIAMWSFGWRTKKISGVLNAVKATMDEALRSCADKSMIEILDDETGVELTIDEKGRSWREIIYLNSELWKKHKNRFSPAGVILANISQKKYVAPNTIAAFLITLHRMYGYGHERLSRFAAVLDDVRRELGENPNLYSKKLSEITGLDVRELPFSEDYTDGKTGK